MAEWRALRGWSETELAHRLKHACSLGRNFSAPDREMTPRNGWHRYQSESIIAHEDPGPPAPDGPFARARVAVENFQFSDPDIVVGHFDPGRPLHGRPMLLEIRVWGLRYLSGVVISDVARDTDPGGTRAGFRYDTLEGHIERGFEWFLLSKDHRTGTIHFRIDSAWRPGDFPNWWSRAGFALLSRHFQERWHRNAHGRLFLLAHHGGLQPPARARGRLAHEGPEVVFRYLRARG